MRNTFNRFQSSILITIANGLNITVLTIIYLVLLSCNDIPDEHNSKLSIYIEDRDPMVFNNSECSFDDHNVQGQYNFTQSFQGEIIGYTTVSTYKNQIGMDSVINQIWFDALFLYDNDHNPIPKDQIKDVLKNRKRDLIMQVQIEDEINKRFHNKRFPHNPSVASYDVIDDFNVEILDFKVPYNAKCIDEELIYLKLQLEGNLYAFDHFTLIDTIYIQETEVSLLFSIN